MNARYNQHRLCVYPVHGCAEDAACRRRPTCETPGYSGFVEDARHSHFLPRFDDETDAWHAARHLVHELTGTECPSTQHEAFSPFHSTVSGF